MTQISAVQTGHAIDNDLDRVDSFVRKMEGQTTSGLDQDVGELTETEGKFITLSIMLVILNIYNSVYHVDDTHLNIYVLMWQVTTPYEHGPTAWKTLTPLKASAALTRKTVFPGKMSV
jgi:hypothetical protein